MAPNSISTQDKIDELVDHVVYYNPKPLLAHGYMSPFIAIYLILGGLLFSRYQTAVDVDEYSDIFIAVSVSVVLQILVLLSSLWSVHCRCFLAFSKVSNVNNAFCAKVVPTANNGSPELVRLSKTSTDGEKPTTWFMFQKTKYIFDDAIGQFKSIEYPTNLSIKQYQEWRGYESEKDLANAEQFYGKNNLEMDIPDFGELFKERATAPFFVFQVFCVALWCLDEFWYYSLFTLFMLVSFESILVQQQLRNMAEIRKMGNKPYTINVYRNRKWRQVLTSELLPKDIVSIGRSVEDNPVPCDLILLRGSCIVDESMLTGESVPQMKEPIETITENREFLTDSSDGKLHMLYGGTKILQHTAPAKDSTNLRAPDNGCIGYVMRTSFNTSQGKLLRTILYGVQRVTANNLETFAFILFLLIFAIAAATYVWRRGSLNPKRNKYKLMLECTLILTSVVPPELPIELSLAVNSSLASLIKFFIYCTEPFRIPFAGKVNICCFDKTGTLTSNNFLVEGVAGLKRRKKEDDNDDEKEDNKKGANSSNIIPVQEAPVETIQVLASCHSLVQLEDGLVGDPLEKATLGAIEWTLTKGDAVIPKKGGAKVPGLKIFHRNHFSSALKRMSVVAGYGTSETTYFAAVKGAPEILQPMFTNLPDNYEKVYLEMSRQGARVLALGHKVLGQLSYQEARDLKREKIEDGLEFVGFLIISCPLKPDSKAVAKELLASSHYLTMITGDAPLTACHVAKELHFIEGKKPTLILSQHQKELKWVSIDEKIKLDLIPTKAKQFFQTYNLCMTGDTLSVVLEQEPKFFSAVLPHIRVFARVAPKQKEVIITSLRGLGFYTLMCGDGTNDVGALKHAHVGVALISNTSTASKPPAVANSTTPAASAQPPTRMVGNRRMMAPPLADIQRQQQQQLGGRNLTSAQQQPGGRTLTPAQQHLANTQERMQKLLAEIEEQEKAAIVKLGDASIAAPFTSKLSSIMCICHIIRQGRCTLVTTLQMFKILALNALILAYCQSVLYLDGIKFSDGQATLQGLFLTGCFLFITRSKPLNVLSSRRPLPNIFNFYTILTVLLQFAVHFVTLVYLVQEAVKLSPPQTEEFPDLESEFQPSLLNSTVYIISVCLQVSTFAVNYKGHPFMCSLNENKPLLYSILGSFGLVVVLVTGIMPDVAQGFSIVPFPEEFQRTLLTVLFGDLTMALVLDRICEFLFGRTSLRKI